MSLTFCIGGSRSGKSARAEALARGLGTEVVYVATCRTAGLDEEMAERIRRHREGRPVSWITVEDRFDLEELAAEFAGGVILLDCLTLWLAHWLEIAGGIEPVLRRLETGLMSFRHHRVTAIVVSNEVGCGLVPMGAEARVYRDLVGWANQAVARQADRVEWLVAGIPVEIKGPARSPQD